VESARDRKLLLVYLILLILILFTQDVFSKDLMCTELYDVQIVDSLSKDPKNTVVVISRCGKFLYFEVSKESLEKNSDKVVKDIMEKIKQSGEI